MTKQTKFKSATKSGKKKRMRTQLPKGAEKLNLNPVFPPS